MNGIRAIAFKVRFTGLYEWGSGWISGSKAEAWNSWFENLDSTAKPSYWGYYRRDGGLVPQHLVCASGSVYLHPLEMSCVMQNSVISRKHVNGEWVEIFPEVEELKEILSGAANACGGIVEFSDITFGELPMPKFGGKGSVGDKKQRKIGIKIAAVCEWNEDRSNADYLFSSMPRSEAYEALATENADKAENGKWEDEHLPCDYVVEVDRDEHDDIDLADDLAANDIMATYHDQINEAAEDFVRDSLCRGDVLLPVGVEWYITSCDGVKVD